MTNTTKFKESFDTEAKQYYEGRLSYPDDVIDWIVEKTCVSKDETLLEIGQEQDRQLYHLLKGDFRFIV